VQLYRLEHRAPAAYDLECNEPYGCNSGRKQIFVSLRTHSFLHVDERLAMSVEDVLISVGGAIGKGF